ncbi:MAG: hypothetical protein IJ930_03625 [Lachnospiraceae bacterium]|nr:hypothetical protein [Lachnospiraceae bacterium]
MAADLKPDIAAPAVKNCIAIVDREVDYACHLMEFLLRETGGLYDVRIFTSAESFENGTDRDRTALLIISGSVPMPEGEFPAVLILNESGRIPDGRFPAVSKYQSGENIIAFIRMNGLLSHAEVADTTRHGEAMRVIGIYSPVSRCLKTTFALTLGQILSVEKRALYMNFEAFPGFLRPGPGQGTGAGASVSDLLYYNECAREKVVQALAGMTISARGLDIVPPARSFQDLKVVACSQWLGLIRTIAEGTEYGYCILDLSELADGLTQILRSCSKIFTIWRKDRTAQMRLKDYEDMLVRTDCQDIYAATVRLELPLFTDIPQDPEMLKSCALADYIRQHLKEWL